MLKGNRKYYVLLTVIFTGVIFLYYSQPKPVNWKRSFAKEDKIPFGCYAIFNLLEDTYATSVKTNAEGIYNLNERNTSTNQSLLIIDNTVSMTKLEIKSLFAFVEKGNTVLLCANTFGKALCDTFRLDVRMNLNFNASSLDSLIRKPAFEIAYVQPKNNALKSYVYPEVATESYFSEMDTNRFSIVALNKTQKPVLLETKMGKGKILLSTLPDVFGNLFIVDHPNRFYTYTLLSKIRNQTIIWDEYYKTYGHSKDSLFAFIFSSDALYMAYCITMLALLLFMIFEIKRKQRSIPVLTPLTNSTLEFVDVVSHVYFNSQNHKHIALETIKYFYFDISKKFNLSTANLDAEFYTRLHKLSGVDLEKITVLFRYCENLKHAPSLMEDDLLELNNRIAKFKKQSIR
jgi:hypothetical protein